MVKLQGSIPALISPMTEQREFDSASFEKMVGLHLDSGTHGLVPMGTSGESPTMSHSEHKQIVDMCVQMVGGKIPVIAGTGSNSTREAIELTTHAKFAGADASLIVVPYYNKPNQEGIYQHYKAIAEEVDMPIIIYNIPSRSVVRMEIETAVRLQKEFPGVFVGMKDATGDPNFTKQLLQAVNGDFISLCGDDGLFHEFADAGSVGTISVTSNVIPKTMAELHDYKLNGETEKFNELQQKLMPLHDILFTEPNPTPTKYAMAKMGMIESDQVRLPLVKVASETASAVDNVLSDLDLI